MIKIEKLEQAFIDYHDAVITLLEDPSEDNYLDASTLGAVIEQIVEEVMR